MVVVWDEQLIDCELMQVTRASTAVAVTYLVLAKHFDVAADSHSGPAEVVFVVDCTERDVVVDLVAEMLGLVERASVQAYHPDPADLAAEERGRGHLEQHFQP